MDLTDDQRRALRQYPPTHAFAVISWGCAATGWLAKALNAHPDIFCVHAGNWFLATLGGAPYMQGVPYLRMLASQGYAHRAAGDVHGVSRSDVPELRRVFRDGFGCAVMVRDPLPRLKSQFSLFRKNAESRAWGDLGYLDPQIRDTGLDPAELSYEDKLTFHGANMLNAILDERAVGRVFRIEDLTTNPAVLLELVDEITNGKVPHNEAWAERIVGTPAVNRHKEGEDAPFDEIQRRAIRTCVRPEAWAAYLELGYDTALMAPPSPSGPTG
jgi:hypothetical protein